MVTIGYLIIAAAAFACLVWAVRGYRQQPNTTMLLIVIPLLFLWFDSFAIAAGRFIGEGPVLLAATYLRYSWHWATLPLLIIVAGMIARRAGFRWAQPKPVMALFCLAAVSFIAIDLPYIWQVQFQPACFGDTFRLVTRVSPQQMCEGRAIVEGGIDTSPAAAITVNLVLMLIGFGLWWKHKFPWLALGCVIMFACAATPQSVVGPILGNFGEPIFNAGLVAAGLRFGGRVWKSDQPAAAAATA